MSENQPFYAVHIKIMCPKEEQYKELCKIFQKMGSKISWTPPTFDVNTKEYFGFINFVGSQKFQNTYILD